MRKTWMKLCLLCVVAVIFCGCGYRTVDESGDYLVEDGISVKDTCVQVGDTSIELSELNENIDSVRSCRWMGKDRIAVQTVIKDNHENDYFMIYDLRQNKCIYKQFGLLFTWQDDNMDSLVFVQNYSESGGTMQVRNVKGDMLFSTAADEQIQTLAYVPKGLKVDVVDRKGNLLRSVLVEALAEKPVEPSENEAAGAEGMEPDGSPDNPAPESAA